MRLFLGVAVLAGVAAGIASANDPKRDDLREITNELLSSGDTDKAVAALAKKKISAKELLAFLRETRRPDAFKGGHQTLDLADGHGRKTDLEVVAPSTEAIQSRAKAGLGLVVLLHGIKGNGKQMLPFAEELAATNEVVAIAPSAQPLPAGLGGEDGIPATMMKAFPHWWLYESNRSFPLEAIKKARSLYPIDPDRIVLCGVSMGGYGTWNVGLRHSDRFAAIAPLAGGLSRLGTVGMQDEKSTAIIENGKVFPVWAAHGDKDGVVPYKPDKDTADRLKELGGDVTFKTLEGAGHDVRSALVAEPKLLDELKAFLTTKKRKTPRLEVNYCSGSEKLDGAYWLRIAKRQPSKTVVRVEGSIDKQRNRVRIAAEGVELARVYLDDRILDFSKSVTIDVGDEARWKGKPTLDMRAILESWKSREDERLVYPAFVELDPR